MSYFKAKMHQILFQLGLRLRPLTVMAACHRVYDSHDLQADCQRPGSAPEPYTRQLSTGYLYLVYCPAATQLCPSATYARSSIRCHAV